MKQQTFIVSLLSKGVRVDFYRYALKKKESVLKDIKCELRKNTHFWKWQWLTNEKADRIEIYATPDGYTETECVFSANLEEFIEEAIA